MQEALDRARKIELENRVQAMLQRQSRYRMRMKMSQVMQLDDHRNTKSWEETIRDVDAGVVEFKPVRRRSRMLRADDIKHNYVVLPGSKWHPFGCKNGSSEIVALNPKKSSRRLPAFESTSHQQMQLGLCYRAANVALLQVPELRDERVVKLRLGTTTDSLRFLKVKIATHFTRAHDYQQVHERGKKLGLWTGIECPNKVEDPLMDVYQGGE